MGTAAEQKAVERLSRRRRRLQLLLMMLDEWFEANGGPDMQITEIRVRSGRGRGGQPLVIVKATYEGQRIIGFHSADDAEAALAGALERVKTAQMKWREDHPYEPPAE